MAEFKSFYGIPWLSGFTKRLGRFPKKPIRQGTKKPKHSGPVSEANGDHPTDPVVDEGPRVCPQCTKPDGLVQASASEGGISSITTCIHCNINFDNDGDEVTENGELVF